MKHLLPPKKIPGAKAAKPTPRPPRRFKRPAKPAVSEAAETSEAAEPAMDSDDNIVSQTGPAALYARGARKSGPKVI